MWAVKSLLPYQSSGIWYNSTEALYVTCDFASNDFTSISDFGILTMEPHHLPFFAHDFPIEPLHPAFMKRENDARRLHLTPRILCMLAVPRLLESWICNAVWKIASYYTQSHCGFHRSSVTLLQEAMVQYPRALYAVHAQDRIFVIDLFEFDKQLLGGGPRGLMTLAESGSYWNRLRRPCLRDEVLFSGRAHQACKWFTHRKTSCVFER